MLGILLIFGIDYNWLQAYECFYDYLHTFICNLSSQHFSNTPIKNESIFDINYPELLIPVYQIWNGQICTDNAFYFAYHSGISLPLVLCLVHEVVKI